MDSNQSKQFASSPSSLLQVHNFMEMPPPPPIFPTGQPSLHELHNFMLMPHPDMLIHDQQAPEEVPIMTILPHQRHQQHEVLEGETKREHRLRVMKHNLWLFWQQQLLEIDQISDFKQHQLPLARIKRIMKADEDVKMISADAPVLFAKSCELFILEITLRAWLNTEENKRRTLQRSDIANAINHGEVLDFLFRIIPNDDIKEEELPRRKTGLAELLPHNGGVSFPLTDVNQYLQNLNPEFMVGQQKIHPHHIVQPPIPSTRFFYGLPNLQTKKWSAPPSNKDAKKQCMKESKG